MCTLQCILLSCDTVSDSAVFRMTAHDICTNSAHDPYANSLWTLTTSMPTALMAYARKANAHDIYANSAHAERSS